MDDRQLVRDARSGDEAAFAVLVRRFSGGMHRTVARILGDSEEAWDVVQMAFVRAWERLDRYDERWSFATWVYRIATNMAIDVLRSRSSRERAHDASSRAAVPQPSLVGSPARRAEQSDVERVMAEVVQVLSPQQRAAFVMREVEGLDTAEVAAVLGCSPTTVRNHIFQARKTLRRELEQRFPEYLPASRS